MKLLLKFNLAMLATFLVGLSIAAILIYNQSIDVAKHNVINQAALINSEVQSISALTDQELNPLLTSTSNGHFLPQSIPYWVANNIFVRNQQKFPDYSLRYATVNPTNPADQAADWEVDLIKKFNKDPEQKDVVLQRKTPTGPTMIVANPIHVTEGCLQCHSTPANAPASMVKFYGPNHGFGWTINSVVAAQLISVPMSVPYVRASQSFFLAFSALTVIFAVMMAMANGIIFYTIIKPAREIAKMADAVSLGELEAEEYEVRGDDEIASLGRSFNRMRRSYISAMNLIED